MTNPTHIYQIKPVKPNLSSQIFQTKPSKPSLPAKLILPVTKPNQKFQTKPTKATKIKNKN